MVYMPVVVFVPMIGRGGNRLTAVAIVLEA